MMTDMFLQIDNSKAGKYAFALTGRRLSTRFIPRVSLRLPWAMRSLGFQPVVPDYPGCQILHTKQVTLVCIIRLIDEIAMRKCS